VYKENFFIARACSRKLLALSHREPHVPACMQTFRVTNRKDGRSVDVPIDPGLTLAQHLYVAGAFADRPLCSGAGRCGLCQVEFTEGAPAPLPEERARIPHARLEAGWRLACRRPPLPGSAVLADRAGDEAPSPLPKPCADNAAAYLGIDLGTTSIAWRFGGEGVEIAGSRYNPQLGAGSEIMSRLALARSPEGAARLKKAVICAVRGIVGALPCLPQKICLAGNTAMTYLALNRDVSGLLAAPYRVDWPGGEAVSLEADLPQIYVPPLVAPFVGADVSAGLLALERRGDAPTPPWLLADLGTNGEFALTLPGGETLVASVPMGPALEGVGMSQGRLAGPGVAVAFELAPGGFVPVLFGDDPAAGSAGNGRDRRNLNISGTGYVSLVARLRRLGIVGESGQFTPQPSLPLAARLMENLRADGGEPCLRAGGATLYASDVEALLQVKAAFSVAVKLLLDRAGLDFTGLAAVCLAGALGEHVNRADLEILGFFPPGGSGKVKSVGNASLEGACLAARDDDARLWLAGLPGRVKLIEVATAPGFQSMYLDAMRFSYVR